MSQVDGGPALPEDEYLTRDQLLELRGVLTEQLDQLLGNSHDAVSNLTSEEETEADTLDIATNASNREFALRLASPQRVSFPERPPSCVPWYMHSCLQRL